MFLALMAATMLGAPAEDKKPEKDSGKAVKILGRSPWKAAPRPGAPAIQLVIRSDRDFARAIPRGSNPKAEQAQLAKQMKVDAFDWQKQMIVAVSAGAQRTGGYRVEVLGVFVKDNVMTVRWKLHSPKPDDIVTQAFTHPAEAVLLETFSGKVVFDPPAPKPKRGKDDKKKPDPAK